MWHSPGPSPEALPSSLPDEAPKLGGAVCCSPPELPPAAHASPGTLLRDAVVLHRPAFGRPAAVGGDAPRNGCGSDECDGAPPAPAPGARPARRPRLPVPRALDDADRYPARAALSDGRAGERGSDCSGPPLAGADKPSLFQASPGCPSDSGDTGFGLSAQPVAGATSCGGAAARPASPSMSLSLAASRAAPAATDQPAKAWACGQAPPFQSAGATGGPRQRSPVCPQPAALAAADLPRRARALRRFAQSSTNRSGANATRRTTFPVCTRSYAPEQARARMTLVWGGSETGSGEGRGRVGSKLALHFSCGSWPGPTRTSGGGSPDDTTLEHQTGPLFGLTACASSRPSARHRARPRTCPPALGPSPTRRRRSHPAPRPAPPSAPRPRSSPPRRPRHSASRSS